MPPENDVSPMTAAAMTSSSFCTPKLVTAELSLAVWMAALTATGTPMRTNVSITVRRGPLGGCRERDRDSELFGLGV
jgi:hypothetical protein